MPNDCSICARCGISWPPPAKPPSATSAADLRCTVGRLLPTSPATLAPDDANDSATEAALSAGEPSDSVSVRLPGETSALSAGARLRVSESLCKPLFFMELFIGPRALEPPRLARTPCSALHTEAAVIASPVIAKTWPGSQQQQAR